MTAPFYITTPIYYVNDVPHLGHAYTTIVADALARFHRMRGEPTRFLTGTDEHGQKIEEAATKRGLTAQQLVDQVAPRFAEAWKTLGITNDHFIRTTDAKHKKVVASLWGRIREHSPDDLYLESYQGWYCVGCEQFYKETELDKVDGEYRCKIHQRAVNWIDKERSWFFKLSRYAEPLLAHIEKHPDFIQPAQYRSEIVAFLKGGLRDLSVSRTSFSWGIPVPESDPQGASHVIYVWMDALVNYLSDLCPEDGSITGPLVDQFWPQAIHLIGKDILRFHSVYWPAFLLAAKLPLPKSIVAHGWWTIRGSKISKSMPATRIDPIALADALGNDAMRYYLLREVPLGLDGDFTFESLYGRYNAELANDLGNLVSRSLRLLGQNVDKVAPAYDGHIAGDGLHEALARIAREVIPEAEKLFDALQPSRALESIWKLVREANRYVDGTQPWALAKDPTKTSELAHTLHNLAAVIGVIGGLISPVLPSTGATLRSWVGVDSTSWPSSDDMIRPVIGPRIARDIKPLFPRLDDAAQDKITQRLIPGVAEAAAAPVKADAPAAPTYASIEDFAKLELRTGKILDAAAVPKKDKLLQLTVDVGEGKPRTIVAGIASAYKPGDLVGKTVIVVANLPPKKLAGVMSQGMVLAAGDDAILGLSAVDHDVPPGTRIR